MDYDDDEDDDSEESDDVDIHEAVDDTKEVVNDGLVWEKRRHYVLLSCCMAFGVRNIFEFPSLVLEHGGGMS